MTYSEQVLVTLVVVDMMESQSSATLINRRVLKLSAVGCHHHEEGIRKLYAYPENMTVKELFDMEHGEYDPEKYEVKITTAEKDFFDVDVNLTVRDLADFKISALTITCKIKLETTPEKPTSKDDIEKPTRNAFEVMMAGGGRDFPPLKTSSSGLATDKGLSRKDELFNALHGEIRKRQLDFSRTTAKTEGTYFLQVLTDALWYITNQHNTINDAAMRHSEVLPVPEPFDQYTGYNDVRRKKVKSLPLSSMQLGMYAERLYSLLLKPYINSSQSWKSAGNEIRNLADCFLAYKKYLDAKAKEEAHSRSQDCPVRTIDKHASVEHRHKTPFTVKNKYCLLDQVVREHGIDNPVVFDENKHIEQPFENNVQRFRYFHDLQLSVPVDIVRFCPGGSVLTTFCIVQVADKRSEMEMLTQASRMVQKLRPHLKEYHTRMQKMTFKQKLSNVAKMQPAVVDFIYKELTLDASTANHPDMQHRLRLIFLGEHGLLADLRHLNPGRPTGRYDEFFQHLTNLVEEVTAADDRRHGTAHLSKWISLSDMIKQAAERCPEGTPIPSKSLVRLQFAPTNPYTRTAQTFTSRIPIQYKIQKRQLRASHPDEHYCAALLKYLKHKAVEMKETAVLFCCDDKAKVQVGEPGQPVSTGVRGRQSIAPATTELVALDHDMTKCSVTPSVVLHCAIPESPDKSFVRGKVVTVVNDSVFQTASPFRHSAVLKNIIDKMDEKPRVLLKYTDGGTDQRNTLESVKCANICLFLEFDLDMIITCRCAPGQSYLNPAERVMSLLNYGLQNCATERKATDDESEVMFKKCNSMAAIRDMCVKHPELKVKWSESIEPVQSLIRNRFLRLQLKDEPVSALDPVSSDCIDILQRHLKGLFPELDLSKLQKCHTKKVRSYNEWKERHCRETTYTFQIRKCRDTNCCPAPRMTWEELSWLPNPMLDESREHYKPYDIVKNEETSEDDRPSLKLQKPTAKKVVKAPTASTPKARKPSRDPSPTQSLDDSDHSDMNDDDGLSDQSSTADVNEVPESPLDNVVHSMAFSAQNARALATCVECRKPRVVYSKTKLSRRQELLLATSLSTFEYTCGAYLFPPSTSSNIRQDIACKPNIQCATPVEIPYYNSELGRKDLCAYCGVEEAYVDPDLRKKYKTVLPICGSCRDEGKTPVVQRPFGRKK